MRLSFVDVCNVCSNKGGCIELQNIDFLDVSSSRNDVSEESSGDENDLTPDKNGVNDKEDKEARKERKRLRREEKEKRREERRRKKLLKNQAHQDLLVCNIVEGER